MALLHLQANWHTIDRLHAPAVQPQAASGGKLGRAHSVRAGGALSFKWMEVLWRQALLHHPNPAVRMHPRFLYYLPYFLSAS